MDKSDSILFLDIRDLTNVALLTENLWTSVGALRRSRELTPLYVQRYTGPCNLNRLSAHPYWEIIFVFRGNGTLLGTTELPLQAGTAVLVAPHTTHCETSPGKLDLLWVGLAGTCLADLPCTSVQSATSSELLSPFEQLWHRARRPQGLIGPELDGLTLAALARQQRIAAESNQDFHALVDMIIDYLQKNYAQPITISDLAERFSYSEGYLCRLFCQRTGLSPKQYLTKVRIEAAIQLIQQTSMNISRIAALVGYQDPLYFSRIFRQVTGSSPITWRSRSL